MQGDHLNPRSCLEKHLTIISRGRAIQNQFTEQVLDGPVLTIIAWFRGF